MYEKLSIHSKLDHKMYGRTNQNIPKHSLHTNIKK